MAYPNDLVGKFIESPIRNPGGTGKMFPQYQASPTLLFTEDQTRQIHRKGGTATVSAVGTQGAGGGQNIQAPSNRPRLAREPAFEGLPWSYTLLQYLPGLVTACRLMPNGILTGWMSGCYLFTYTFRGATHVAHVGTAVDDADNTGLAKRTWKQFADGAAATNVYGCNVAREVPDEAIAACGTGGFIPYTAGYFAPDGTASILVFGSPVRPTEGVGVYYKLLTCTPMPMTPWAAIRTIPLFA